MQYKDTHEELLIDISSIYNICAESTDEGNCMEGRAIRDVGLSLRLGLAKGLGLKSGTS